MALSTPRLLLSLLLLLATAVAFSNARSFDQLGASLRGGQALQGGVHVQEPNIFVTGGSESNTYTTHVYPARDKSKLTYLPSATSTDPTSPIPHAGAFEEMQREVDATRSGDIIVMSGWEFNFTYPLPVTTTYRNWGELLTAKAKAGVKIRLMLSDWDTNYGTLYDVLHQVTIPAMVDAVKTLSTKTNFQFFTALHPATCYGVHIGSHHQKTIAIRSARSSRLVAFVGGLDIANDRDPKGWIDAVLKAEGKVAYDVYHQMVMRWKYYVNRGENTAPNAATVTSLWGSYDTSMSTTTFTDVAVATATHSAQLVRTISIPQMWVCSYGSGRTDIFTIYLNMISNAESYIYIEDQYARDHRIANAIVDRARTKTELVVVIFVERLPDPEALVYSMTQRGDAKGNFLQHGFFNLLTQNIANSNTRVGLYFSGTHYIHSKVMIVDDKWMTVGSANTNQRSMRLDTEGNLAVDNADFVKSARIKSWALHLGKDITTVTSWAVSSFIAKWNEVAQANAPLATGPQRTRTGSGGTSGGGTSGGTSGGAATFPIRTIPTAVKGTGVLINDNTIRGQDSNVIGDDLVRYDGPDGRDARNDPNRERIA